MAGNEGTPLSPLRERLFKIIFHHDTKAGKNFDIILLVAILISVIIVMLESVESFNAKYGLIYKVVEWILTIFFTVEYIFRLWITRKPMKYALSFWGIVDLLAIIPTYLSLLIAGSQQLIIIRALRLLRAFRIFRLAGYMRQGRNITRALRASRMKIEIFMSFVIVLVVIIGCIMYLVEGGQNDEFDSIPRSIYWAIVTLTTVGYGDISPDTTIGQFLAAAVMILGYAIIAVPTGIVSAELVRSDGSPQGLKDVYDCQDCSWTDHSKDALFCKFCGEQVRMQQMRIKIKKEENKE